MHKKIGMRSAYACEWAGKRGTVQEYLQDKELIVRGGQWKRAGRGEVMASCVSERKVCIIKGSATSEIVHIKHH